MNVWIKKTDSFKPSLLAAAIAATMTSGVYAAEVNLPAADQSVDEILVVTGSRTEEKLEDVAGAVSVISADDIDVQVSNGLADVFRYDPSIQSTGTQGQAQTLSIRGIGGNRVVYIKDGRRLNDAYAGGGGYLVGRGYLDVAQVQQIEVAKAAASPLYGSDGLGGVIVISTPDPGDLLKGDDSAARLNFGFDGLTEETKLGFSGARQFDGSSAMIQVSARQGEETQNYEESLPGYDYDSQSILAKWTLDIGNDDELKFTLDHFQQDTEQFLAETNQTDDDNRQTALSVDYQRNQANTFADSQHWQLYVTDYEQGSDQVSAGASQAGAYTDYNDYGFEQRIMGARWQAQKQLDAASTRHDLVYGFDADYYDTERPRFKTRIATDGTVMQDNEPQKAFPGAETWLTGVFLQDNIAFKETAFRLIIGARVDHYEMSPNENMLYDMSELADISETAFSPKVAGIYTFDSGVRGYLQYAEGFKIPPHDQAYQNHGIEPFYAILPNPDLQPESSRAVEAGLKFSNDTTRWNLAAFYSRFDDFIETAVVGTSPTYIPGVDRVEYQYVNQDEVTIKGAEASVTHWLTDFVRIDTSAAYVTGENDATGEALTSLSPLSGNVSFGYFADNWHIRGIVNAVAEMDDVPSASAESGPYIETAGYTTVDVLAGMRLGDWQVNVAALNLTDKYYVPYQRVAGLSADAPTEQYSQPGRSFAIQASYRF
ncbi:TonB-dependent hemoglobin/transferrin/lactoferrin family receptor [Idiomarina sp. UBA3162]|uniref:TonB-dependent hemoglobin/transferrin/lactoferrin family receptor n=1 Tax=unclassified Idiomarina TaxID=2614829 RepID=UPI000C9753B1|nr:TonB-dependent hemoglobin/transferrin/lactoferrin family receptor [Idiomarina sp. UBA3162]MAD54039.1 hypothetical protein [Idiomarinaceae bacterium]